MKLKMFTSLILLILISGCITAEEQTFTEAQVREILNQKNPELCLDYGNEEVSENLSKSYVRNIEKIEDNILFRDLCLIYTLSLTESVNDQNIVLCNEASERIYKFLEEGSYDIPAWEFCFRKAFGEYKSYPQPPRSGNIRNKDTCEKLKDFRDNCLWLVAMNNKNDSICDMMSNTSRTELCREELGK